MYVKHRRKRVSVFALAVMSATILDTLCRTLKSSALFFNSFFGLDRKLTIKIMQTHILEFTNKLIFGTLKINNE